jgi:sugar phosphate permease
MTPLPAVADKQLYLRIGRRLIPFLLLCYIFAMIDRLNVGFAKLQFLSDLHLNEAAFGMAAAILYVGFILFEVPSNLLLDRSGIRITLLRIMSLWGLFTMGLAFAANEYHFYILRFLVGAAEAGFFPGIVVYLTYWFPDRYRGRVTSMFAVGVPLSGLIAGPISGWIMTYMNGTAGFHGWQWLFLLEGLPAVVLGTVAYLYLADRPGKAAFLTPAEKAAVAADLANDEAKRGVGTPKSFLHALRTPRVWGLGVVWFAFYALQSVLLIWVPTLLKSAGVNALTEIGWRAGLISACGVVGMICVGISSDRSGDRRWHLIGCGCVAAAMYLSLRFAAASPNMTTLLLGVAAAAVFGFLGLFWTVPAALLDPRATAGGIAFISSIGALGSVFAPTFIGWSKELTGSFYGAVGTLGVMMIVAMVVLYICIPRDTPEAGRAASGSLPVSA